MLVITSAWLGVFYRSVISTWNIVWTLPLFSSWVSNIFKVVLITFLGTHTSTVDNLRLTFSYTSLWIVRLCILIRVSIFTCMINSLSTSRIRLVVDSRVSHLIICLDCILTSNFFIWLLLLISDVVAYWVLVIMNYIRSILEIFQKQI